MKKASIGHLFLLVLFTIFTLTSAYAQTITVGNVDPGPYGQGSTIAIPFHVTGGSCIQQNNKYNLYLSDASGNFVAGGKLIGSFTGFYTPFINGIIPNGTPAGAGYKVIVSSTSPVISSAASGAFSISASPAIKAAVNSSPIDAIKFPEVFGQCNGIDNTSFPFINASTPASATVTATFLNEQTQAFEGGNPSITTAGYNFIAHDNNYTVVVKAASGGIVATKAYELINNVVNSNIGNTGAPPVCLDAGSAPSTFNVNILNNFGIQNNYPGDTYLVKWGDGTQTSYTLCEIQALAGQITHNFTSSSCGITSNNNANSFEIDLQPVSPYCGAGTKSSTYTKILIKPVNKFSGPLVGCAGSPLTFTNISSPGPNPNSTTSTCLDNPNAQFEWLVDDVHAAFLTLHQNFVLPANTPAGLHTIKLRLLNGNCTADDYPQDVCIQNPPKLKFTLPAGPFCLSGGPLIPANTSIVDAGCNVNNPYTWTVSPATFTFSGGTNANSPQPEINFTAPGIYNIQLSITTATCGTMTTAKQSIVVDGPPVASLSADASLCGNNQTLSFDPNPGPTKTILTGTAQTQPTTYTWAVTGGAFSFQGGTNANSQYPQILFNDFATYAVKVTQQNSCGTTTATQNITFQQAPTVTAGAPQSICEGSQANLKGTIVGTVNSFQWVGGTGTFTAGRNQLITNYIPSAAEINAGKATLTLQATTALSAPCDIITSNITITIIPTDKVTSQPALSVCTGQALNYAITASDPVSTFTWTASVTSGTATGFTANGSGNIINDIINNTDPNTDAVVTYKITPKNSGCPGTVFTLSVTVNPLPKITAAPVNTSICSNQPANIILTSNIPNTSFTWTSTASAGITGNTDQTNPVANTDIQDVLVNNSTIPATVIYTITPYNGTCPGMPKTATITIQPLPVESVPGPDEEICFTAAYTLHGNNPTPGTGKWTQVSGPTVAVFSDDTNPNAKVTGLTSGKYQFSWTITAAPTCPPNSNVVNITIDKATAGGTTSGTSTVCADGNGGQISLSGQVGSILRWELSTDNGTTWQPIINTTTTQAYLNLTQTTQYRAISQSGICSTMASSVSTITVNQPTIAADAGKDQNICNQTSAILNGNDPSPFNGVWTQTAGPQVTIVNPASHQTQVTGLASGNVYTFVWTIKGLPPCADSQSSVNVNAAADITANFSQDKTRGCGSTTVTFINISTPNTSGSYLWDFGDGTTSVLTNPLPHTFAPSSDGKEVTYTITLTPTSNCGVKKAFTSEVKVSPQIPVAKLFPSQTTACGAFTLTAKNLSPGNNVQYDFYLTDVNGNILQHLPPLTDKTDAVFQPINPTKPTDYQVYVVATDLCGNTGQSVPITISGSPSAVSSLMQIKGNPQSVCLGNSVTFQNISSGGDRFTYTIYDADKNILTTIPADANDLNYIPTAAGRYYVSIIAGNNGCGDAPESPLRQFDVYPDPQPDFSFKLDNDYNVIFTNNTPGDGNTPPESLSYIWDFGDGSAPETGFEPKHHYDYNKSPFTATLTATNVASKCFGVTSKTIIVKFLGGIYLPNAFMPASSNSELNIFKAKGTGIKEWRMQIFNNFGQLIWETTSLDNNGSPIDGWDGTFKGNPVQQGVYVWQISATFANGSEWKGMSYNNSLPKRTGAIHLIR